MQLEEPTQNVLIIDKEEIQNKGYTNLEQALESQAMINFVDTGFGRNIDIRGQGKDANRAVKVMVNGVPLNSLDIASGVAAFNSINIEDIESIEIIPGGGAVLYGNGTRGGVVNIVTKKAEKDFLKASIKGSSGEAKNLQGGLLSLSGGKKINDKLFINASIAGSFTPNPRNTGKSEPFTFDSYTDRNPWTNLAYVQNGWATNCPTTPAFIDSSGKAWYYRCLQYRGAMQNGDNTGTIYTNFGANYDISESQRLEFNLNYAHSWINRPANRLDSYTYRCTPNPNFTPGGTQLPFNCTRNIRGAPIGTYYQLSKDELKDWRYTASDSIAKMQTNSLQTSLLYSHDLNQQWNFSALGYYQMNLMDYGTYMEPDSFGFNDLTGSAFNNHNGGVNLKAKYESPKNTLLLGLDNTLGYAERKAVIHMDLQSLGLLFDTYALNTALKGSISPYIYNSFHISDKFDINAGARLEYSHYRVTNKQSFSADCHPTTDPTSNLFCPLVTGNLKYSSTPDFNERADRFAYALELTPSYRYRDSGRVYLKTELGFISPSPFQMIDADPDAEVNQGGNGINASLLVNTFNDLQPEKYITAELGVSDGLYLDSFEGEFSVAGYYTHTFDEIFLNQTSGSLTYIYRNLGETQRSGVELDLRQRVFDNRLRFSQSVGYVWTNIKKAGEQLLSNLQSNNFKRSLEGERVPFVPFLKASIKAELDVIASKQNTLTLFGIGTYTSDNKTLFAPVQVGVNRTAYSLGTANKGGYFLLDVGANWQYKKWRFSAGVRNALDTVYSTYAHSNFITLAMGRTYFAEVKWEY